MRFIGILLLILIQPASHAQALIDLVKDVSHDILKNGTYATGHGGDLLFVIETGGDPVIFINDERGPAAKKDGALRYVEAKLPVGRTHNFYWLIDGVRFGGKTDVPSAPREKAEEHKRVVIGVRAGADEPAAMIGGGIGPEHVIGRHQVGEASLLRGLCVVAQHRRTRADIGHRYRSA